MTTILITLAGFVLYLVVGVFVTRRSNDFLRDYVDTSFTEVQSFCLVWLWPTAVAMIVIFVLMNFVSEHIAQSARRLGRRLGGKG